MNHVRNLGLTFLLEEFKDEHTVGTWQPKGTKK